MKDRFTNFIKRAGLATAAFVLAVASVSTLALSHTRALSVTTVHDCDDNAVVFCGADSTQALITKYTNGDGHNSVKSVHDIYSYFGISASEVQALNSTAVAGHVTKDGHVFVDSSATAVASSAMTGGRQNIAGSTAVTSNGTAFFTRPSSVSFASNSLAAFVVMKGGVFQYAVLASCGNPVKATATPAPAPAPKPTPTPTPTPTPAPTPTPTPTPPAYTVTKQVATKGSSNFGPSVQVSQGTHVMYRVTVKSTGTAPVTNLVTSDTLPDGVTFVSGSFSQNGAAADDSVATQFFGDGVTVDSLAAGSSDVFSFEAVVGSSDAGATCTPQTLSNVAHTTATSLQPGSATATVNEQCVSTPQCTNLAVDTNDHTVTVNTVNLLLNGATVQKATIDWGDNTATNDVTDVNQLNGQTHTYTGNGPFTITAHVTFAQNGQTTQSAPNSCQATVSFSSPAVVAASATQPTPPAQPASLVNTGPGSVLGMFAVVTALAAFAHRYWTVRRISHDSNL